ncbi:MAG: N-acyl homoserine lactonase family protein [Candidatus Bathyarchaeota archaeon]|nr:MAG: N-acyl homoserine lactonase family protein [Candidatus Bathyarchaeota archaeon]
MNIHLLRNGCFTIAKNFLVYGKYRTEIYKAALKPMLVMTRKEKILVDTGIGELPPHYGKRHQLERSEDQTMQAQLSGFGLKPEDITIVINTHLHFDHCGRNRLFRKARFYVQADELRYAYRPDRFQKAAYLRDFFDVDVDYESVRGRYRITDDVTILPTPGHSIGHQSVIVKKDAGNLVYCGDAAPLRENLAKRNIPGVLYRADEALQSIDRLRTISNASYIFSHDNEQRSL